MGPGAASQDTPQPGFAFTNIAREAGLSAVTVFGGERSNRYLLETTGCGVALFDYDNDGRLDIFIVNGTTLEGFPKGQAPISHLYRNRGDGTFEDVTAKAGVGVSGWGQGAAAADYDNDGDSDLFVTFYGQNRLFRNDGDGTFTDVTARAGLATTAARDGARAPPSSTTTVTDGSISSSPTTSTSISRRRPRPIPAFAATRASRSRAVRRGCPAAPTRSTATRATAPSTMSPNAPGILKAAGTYGLGVSTFDFDDDGWTDVYVANDSNPSALYRNNRDGTFTDIGVRAGCAYSQDGKPQAGMGVGIGDYDRNGTFDIVKTNFAGDTTTLYANLGRGFCEDRTFAAGLGINTRWLGWGAGFVDFDNDGWLDIFLVNGHVYPEVSQLKTEAAYKQRKVVYRNLGTGRFVDVTERLGPPASTPTAGRGAAFGDLDDDGDIDIVVNNVHDRPDVFRTENRTDHRWLTVRLVGTTSNRSAIGARVRVVAGDLTLVDEVRGGGSYLSQNDLRVHFGLGATPARARRGALAERQRGTLGRDRVEPHRGADGGRRAATQRPSHRSVAARTTSTARLGVGRPRPPRVFLLRSQRQREHRRIARSPARRTAQRSQQEHPHRQTPRVRAEARPSAGETAQSRCDVAPGDRGAFPLTLVVRGPTPAGRASPAPAAEGRERLR